MRCLLLPVSLMALAALVATPAHADRRAELIAQMEASGKNAYQDERHSLRVDGCTIITERWKDVPDHGWTLWTSFTFAMMDANLLSSKKAPEEYFFFAGDEDKPDPDFVVVQFKMREGTTARHEKSVLRKSKKETRPSPRNDGTTHYFVDQVSFVIIHEGPDVYEKAMGFTTAYREYKRDFCTFTG